MADSMLSCLVSVAPALQKHSFPDKGRGSGKCNDYTDAFPEPNLQQFPGDTKLLKENIFCSIFQADLEV